jgi:hypothetical protein
MTIPRRFQRTIIGTFGLILTLPGLLMIFDPEVPWWFRLIGFCLVAVVIAPSLAFLRGVNWCRFIVGVLAAIFLLFWSLSPLAQHAIDRHIGFWCLWALGEVVLILTTIASFMRSSQAQNVA